MIPRKCKYCNHREVHKSRFESFSEPPLITISSLCVHEKSKFWNSVSEQYEFMTTLAMRNKNSPCGPDAILWENME